jgi:membrane protease YdiL (CAAX protease family)
MAVFAVLIFQLPMLLAFYALRRFYPGEFSGQLSDISLPLTQAFAKTVPLFIMFLPVIWLAALVWNYALKLLEGLGVIGEAEPQELITLLQGGGDPLAIVLLAVFAIVLAPIVEELIFRGCLYRFLKSHSTDLPAQIMSGALFSLIHFNLFSFLPLVIVGILLARVYEKSGSILTPICFHALFNGFNLLILFLGSISNVDIQ